MSEVYHYGVKGMRWGYRKKELASQPRNEAYTDRMRANDRKRLGKKAELRVNEKMNKGDTRDNALKTEAVRKQTRILLATYGTIAAISIAQSGIPQAVVEAGKHGTMQKAHINRMKRRGQQQFSNKRGLPSIKIADMKRGAYNIASM